MKKRKGLSAKLIKRDLKGIVKTVKTSFKQVRKSKQSLINPFSSQKNNLDTALNLYKSNVKSLKYICGNAVDELEFDFEKADKKVHLDYKSTMEAIQPKLRKEYKTQSKKRKPYEIAVVMAIAFLFFGIVSKFSLTGYSVLNLEQNSGATVFGIILFLVLIYNIFKEY